MTWKNIVLSWVPLAILVLIGHHFDPIGTDVGLIVVGSIVGGIALWTLVKYGLMSPERRAEKMAGAIAASRAESVLKLIIP